MVSALVLLFVKQHVFKNPHEIIYNDNFALYDKSFFFCLTLVILEKIFIENAVINILSITSLTKLSH